MPRRIVLSPAPDCVTKRKVPDASPGTASSGKQVAGGRFTRLTLVRGEQKVAVLAGGRPSRTHVATAASAVPLKQRGGTRRSQTSIRSPNR